MFGLELFGAFVAGIAFTIAVLAVSAKPLSRWAMRKMMTKATGRMAAEKVAAREASYLSKLEQSIRDQGGIE